MKNWAIIENDKELKEASIRFEKIRMAKKGEADYKEKMLLLLLISEYEEQKSTLPDVDPIINNRPLQRNMATKELSAR